VSDFTPTLPLDGFYQQWNGLIIKEHDSSEIVSLAVAQGQEKTFMQIFKKTFGMFPPKPAKAIALKDGFAIWSTPDQYFLILDNHTIDSDRHIAATFSGTAYTTLQTDGWACIDIMGESIYDILDRVLALDLRNASLYFATRTSAYHMAVIIVKLSDRSFRLMTPRSSAHSFIKMLIHTADNVFS